MSKANVNRKGYQQTKIGWIPKEWKLEQLEQLGQFYKGKGISKNEITDEGYFAIRYGEIYTDYDYYVKTLNSKIDETSAINSFKLKFGDVLFTGSGEKVEDIGKSIAYLGKDDAYAGGDLIIFRNHNQDALLLGYILNSNLSRRQIFKLGQGYSVVHIYSSSLKKLLIPIPPLEEQKKIAEILSTWDEVIETTERLIEKLELRKKGLMQQLLTGKTRLSGFTNKWTTKEFNELFFTDNDKSKQVKKSHYLEYGKFPIVDQSKEAIASYSNLDNVYNKVPTIIFGDHTRIVKYIDFDFIIGADGTQILKTNDILNLKYGYYLLSFIKLPNLGYSRHLRELKQSIFDYPKDINEQKAIADILTKSDQEIDLHKQQLEKLKKQKKGLMQKLLNGEVRVHIN